MASALAQEAGVTDHSVGEAFVTQNVSCLCADEVLVLMHVLCLND